MLVLFFSLLISLIQQPWPALAEACSDYSGCRRVFLEKTQACQMESYTVPSSIDHQLVIDSAWCPSIQSKRMLLVISSGIHGLEGPVGSWLQSRFVDESLAQWNADGFDVLLIHGLNPFGFKYGRRVTENNVDLNRNFSLSPELFKTPNPSYRKMDEHLNPKEKVDLGTFESWHGWGFILRSIRIILTVSMESARQAILQGQYDDPKGLYFGGKQFEPQVAWVESQLRTRFKNAEKILFIDLHTGYGENGKLHFLPDSNANQEDRKIIEQYFSGYVIDYGDQEHFYKVHGGYVEYASQLNLQVDQKKRLFIPMVFEYGTMNSQSTLGSIRSLYRMVLENQGHHYGYHQENDQRRVKEMIQDMYAPQDPLWRKSIVQQSDRVLNQLRSRLK